jgi:hypothetical protein
MAEMIIMLRRDPNTGKQNIIVKLDSDPDSLPMEHEQKHKALVQKLTGLKDEDLGEVIIVREPEAQPTEPSGTPSEPQKKQVGNRG